MNLLRTALGASITTKNEADEASGWIEIGVLKTKWRSGDNDTLLMIIRFVIA